MRALRSSTRCCSVLVLGLLTLLVTRPGLVHAATCDTDASAQPMLVLTEVKPGCESDPVAQCLSQFSLEITSAACNMRPVAETLPEATSTVRLQQLWDAGDNIKRNAMDSRFPFIGSNAYDVCRSRVERMPSVGGTTINLVLAALFDYVDTEGKADRWSVQANGSSSFVATHADTGCSLSYSVLLSGIDTYTPVVSGASEDEVNVTDGSFAMMVSQDASAGYISALCPSGTYSVRSGSGSRTIKTGCEKVQAGFATNQVGASSGNIVECAPGTVSSEGAAMCTPCDVDMFAPFSGMPVCAACQDGFAPVQGSTRCFAGFGGRVLVTEGTSRDGERVYDPNGQVTQIYGDDSSAVSGSARFPNGTTFTTEQNTREGVPALGGPLEGWAAIRFAAAPSVKEVSLDWLDVCANGTISAAVLVSEDGKTATISALGSNVCGQINDRTEDMLTVPPGLLTDGDSNFANLTLSYASPTELIAFGTIATAGSVIVYVFQDGTSVKFTLMEQADTPDATPSAMYIRNVTTLANTFGATVPATAPSCPPGTSFVQKGDSSGTTYTKQCQPCADGYYCPVARAGFSPVSTPCPAGTRGTVFGAISSSQCVTCKGGYYQDTPGSMECDACGTAPPGATTCPTSCPDGAEGDPRNVDGCSPCRAGTWRSGDMPSCIACGVGSEIIAFNATGTGVDIAIDARVDTGGQDCRPCAPGSFNDYNTTGVCKACDPGSYAPRGGLTTCLPCAMGSWQDASGAVACKKAAKGTFIDFIGAKTNNQTCAKGYFGEIAGAVNQATSCMKCRPGTFSNATGSTFCSQCRIGSYQDKSAQTSCTPCPAGTVNTAGGSATCAICAPGSFSARGASTCSRCPVGTFQDRARQSGCKACPAGNFCPQAGMIAPMKCPQGTFNPRPNGSSQRLACLPCAKNTAAQGATKC